MASRNTNPHHFVARFIRGEVAEEREEMDEPEDRLPARKTLLI